MICDGVSLFFCFVPLPPRRQVGVMLLKASPRSITLHEPGEATAQAKAGVKRGFGK